MSVVFDIISSFVIRGVVIITIIKLMITLNEALYKNTEQVYLNELISAPAQVITSELKLAGYNHSTNPKFLISDTTAMQFYADVNNDGTAETVHFYVAKEAGSTHKILYRKRSNETKELEIARQVDTFYIRYFNSLGVQVNYGTTNGIKSVFVKLVLESKNTYSSVYSGSTDNIPLKAIWERHFFPQNL